MNGLNVLTTRGENWETRHPVVFSLSPQTPEGLKKFPTTEEILPPVFLRSSAKLFQSVPLLQHPQSQVLLPQQWAIVCASHNGAADRIELVKSVLDLAEVGPEALQCGPHIPIDADASMQLLCSNQSPTALHNNCSGKHAGMLFACRLYGWPIENYLDPNHPLQQAILAVLSKQSGIQDIPVAIDGCGAPVAQVPLEAVAKLFESFATNPLFQPLREVMTDYPEIIGDSQRVDTLLMQVTQGNLLAKVGADGMLGVANQALKMGLAMKCIDGNNAIRDLATIHLLEALGWLTSEQVATLHKQPNLSLERKNTQGKTIGTYLFK